MSALLDALRGVANAAEPVPGLVTGGQPTTQHLARLREAGCQVVLDIRDPLEPRPFRTPEEVRAAGLEYVNIPVRHAGVPHETFARVRETVRDLVAAGRATLFHCASGNRVGGTMIPYLMLDRGLSEDEAVMEAMKMGTRSADLIERALAYVRRERSGAPP
jgi:protein tyrosine phosphatase (PTP) superfamily phosphohydrolase (DUF442 family)